jgi:hypothetical protein
MSGSGLDSAMRGEASSRVSMVGPFQTSCILKLIGTRNFGMFFRLVKEQMKMLIFLIWNDSKIHLRKFFIESIKKCDSQLQRLQG